MDKDYQKLVEVISEKLGTTAEHLWDVLVQQAPISGAVDLALCLGAVLCAVWWVRVVIRKTSETEGTKENPYAGTADWEGEGAAIAWILTGAMCVVVESIVLVLVPGIVAAFANPKYWALMQLMK